VLSLPTTITTAASAFGVRAEALRQTLRPDTTRIDARP
jgi:hypothetical protein